ncbi:MAG TPA: Ca2+-dependent phosphoinositide-specific phospholipase C [Polyangiales bacterium]
MLRPLQALSGALLGAVVAASGACAHLPDLGNLSYLAPREVRGSMLYAAARAPQAAPPDATHPSLTLNEVQLKGSHNSYHRAPRIALARSWRYSHAPLETQLSAQGVRQFELDVRLSKGELRVAHLPLVDGRSTCSRLVDCLGTIKTWSRAHGGHLPVFVFIEVKEDLAPSTLEGRLDAIDFAITRVFTRDQLLMPEDVARDAPSLKQAIVEHGWPSIEDTRGRIAFVMFGPKRHKRAYSAGRPRLDGRVMFVAERETDHPHTSVVFYDHPILDRAEIDKAVASHFLVRTRADEDLRRDVTRRDAALASGANFISSDFVDPRYGWLELGPHAAGRCTPASVKLGCTPMALSEDVPSSLATR